MNRKEIPEKHVGNLVKNGQISGVQLSSFKGASLVNKVTDVNRSSITGLGGNNKKDI